MDIVKRKSMIKAVAAAEMEAEAKALAEAAAALKLALEARPLCPLSDRKPTDGAKCLVALTAVPATAPRGGGLAGLRDGRRVRGGGGASVARQFLTVNLRRTPNALMTVPAKAAKAEAKAKAEAAAALKLEARPLRARF